MQCSKWSINKSLLQISPSLNSMSNKPADAIYTIL
jgi:hypothetical protein